MCVVCFEDTGSDATQAVATPPAADLLGPLPTRLTGSEHGLTEEQLAAGRELVRRVPTVDIHAHPGRFFMPPPAERSAFMARYAAPFAERAVADMRAGGVAAVLFSTVADNAVLGVTPRGLGPVREFAGDEALRDHRRQLAALARLEDEQRLLPGRDPADVMASHQAADVACIKAVEGGDFVEDRLERLAEAHAEGVRAITIIHYRTNQIGDTQTQSEVHGGLSPLGRDTVREMNRVGIVVDLAHATLAATRDAAAVSTQPMMISHSNIGHGHPRLITAAHARLVTDRGGLVGAVPAGFGGQQSFGDYVDTLLRMAELIGVEHLAIGTDMDFTFRPVFTSYADWGVLPAALLARGMHEREVAQVLGGNFLRLFAAVCGGAAATSNGSRS